MNDLTFDRRLSPNSNGYYYLNIPKAVAAAYPSKRVRLTVSKDHIEIWPIGADNVR